MSEFDVPEPHEFKDKEDELLKNASNVAAQLRDIGVGRGLAESAHKGERMDQSILAAELGVFRQIFRSNPEDIEQLFDRLGWTLNEDHRGLMVDDTRNLMDIVTRFSPISFSYDGHLRHRTVDKNGAIINREYYQDPKNGLWVESTITNRSNMMDFSHAAEEDEVNALSELLEFIKQPYADLYASLKDTGK